MRKELLFLFLFLLLTMFMLSGCGSSGNGESGSAYQGGESGNTSQVSSDEQAVVTYLQAYELYQKLKENSNLSIIDRMNQVSDLLKTQSNVSSISIDASYRVIEFVADGTTFMIDDIEDFQKVDSYENTSINNVTKIDGNNYYEKKIYNKVKDNSSNFKVLPLRCLLIGGIPNNTIDKHKRDLRDILIQKSFSVVDITSNNISDIAENFRNINNYGALIIITHSWCLQQKENAQLLYLFSKEASNNLYDTFQMIQSFSNLENELKTYFPFLQNDEEFKKDCSIVIKNEGNQIYWIVNVRPSFFRQVFPRGTNILENTQLENTLVYLYCCNGCTTKNPKIIFTSNEQLKNVYLFSYSKTINNDMVNSFLNAGSPVVYASSWVSNEMSDFESCKNIFKLVDTNNNVISEKEGFIRYGADYINKAFEEKDDRLTIIADKGVTVNQSISELNYENNLLVKEYNEYISNDDKQIPIDWNIGDNFKYNITISNFNNFLVRFVSDKDVECFFGNDINIIAH